MLWVAEVIRIFAIGSELGIQPNLKIPDFSLRVWIFNNTHFILKNISKLSLTSIYLLFVCLHVALHFYFYFYFGVTIGGVGGLVNINCNYSSMIDTIWLWTEFEVLIRKKYLLFVLNFDFLKNNLVWM